MLIGRRLELATCENALAHAIAGRGRLLVVSGEAGIGKTTIARSVVDSAEAAGVVVRWGACWESDRSGFGVWIDALRWPGDDPCAEVVDRLERGSTDIVDEASAVRARRRLFDDVADALRAAARRAPQLVVLEDVHWADDNSLELLSALTAKLPVMAVLVLVTCRPDELPTSSLGVGGAIEHLAVAGLGLDEAAAVLERSLGRAPSAEEAGEIHARTGGNPLFVTEVGRLAACGSMAGVPAGVREILRRRMARLSTPSDHLLGVASVLGDEVDGSSIAELAGVPIEEVRALLDEAVRARLLEADPVAIGRWRFAHELVRTTRYEALGAAERARLHRLSLAVLGDAGVSASVLHHHAMRADLGAEDDRLARFALEAGHEAVARFAWPDAIALYDRARAAAPGGAGGDALRAEAWLGLGGVRVRTGGDAGEAFVAAARAGRAQGAPELIARAALGFAVGFGGFEVRLLDPRQIELLEEAADALPEDAALRPMVLARLSVALSFVGSSEQRLALADRALELARARSDEEALVAALAARCDALAGPDHVDERLAMSSEIVDVARRGGEPRLELLGRRLRVVARLERRDLTGFDAEVSAYSNTAEQLGDPLFSWWAPLWRATRAHAAGRFREARELRAEARRIGVAGGSSNADLLYLVAELFQVLDEADASGFETAWTAVVERHPDLFHQEEAVAGMRALASARFGDVSACRAVLASTGPEAVARLPRDQEWLTVVTQYLVAAVVADDDAVTRQCYELLLPYRGLGVFEGAAAVDRGVVDRFLATAAAHLGDAPAARAHAEAALVGNLDAGALLLAQTRADVAAALLRGSPDDVTRAREIAGRALEDFAALGLDAEARRLRVYAGSSAPRTGQRTMLKASLVREGDAWAVTFGGATVRVAHAKGIADLAVLLGHPGQEIHVRVLGGVDGLALPTGGDAVLDDAAVAQYRRRLADLERDLDEAERHADLGRAEMLAVERDALVDELTGAFGLRGRARTAGSDPDERLRKAVAARIKASIGRIEELHPRLGHHLRHGVRTGYRCSYDPEEPIAWHLETEHRA